DGRLQHKGGFVHFLTGNGCWESGQRAGQAIDYQDLLARRVQTEPPSEPKVRSYPNRLLTGPCNHKYTAALAIAEIQPAIPVPNPARGFDKAICELGGAAIRELEPVQFAGGGVNDEQKGATVHDQTGRPLQRSGAHRIGDAKSPPLRIDAINGGGTVGVSR